MNAERSAVPAVGVRLWCIGLTTFLFRSYRDIVRYSILTIAPSAIMAALYLVIFGDLIGPRIGAINGFDYKLYIAPGLIVMPVITSCDTRIGIATAIMTLACCGLFAFSAALVQRGIGIRE
jgi:hypothetical protein